MSMITIYTIVLHMINNAPSIIIIIGYRPIVIITIIMHAVLCSITMSCYVDQTAEV